MKVYTVRNLITGKLLASKFGIVYYTEEYANACMMQAHKNIGDTFMIREHHIPSGVLPSEVEETVSSQL